MPNTLLPAGAYVALVSLPTADSGLTSSSIRAGLLAVQVNGRTSPSTRFHFRCSHGAWTGLFVYGRIYVDGSQAPLRGTYVLAWHGSRSALPGLDVDQPYDYGDVYASVMRAALDAHATSVVNDS